MRGMPTEITKANSLRWEDIVGEITEDEFNILVEEISERIKDIIYMDVKPKVRRILWNLVISNPYTDDKVEVKWTISFVIEDLIQIIGRIRRNKEKQHEKKG